MEVEASCCGAAFLQTGNLVKVETFMMRKEQHIKILEENLKQAAENLNLEERWTYQQDNDPKQTAKEVKKWIQDEDINGRKSES